jgi:4-hydroxy-tetrahydrodipicolinate synthase
MFTGTYTALVTPFRDGEIDEPAYRNLIEEQIKGGVDGIVPVGTTGESPTVNDEEHLRLIKIAVETAGGRCKVIAGTGANSTAEAVHLTQEAEKLGADASLQVSPYYNKPTPEGMYQHFKTVAAETGLPLVLYSVPGRTGRAIEVETVVRLMQDCPSIRVIKEAGGDVNRVSELRTKLPDDAIILSGDDPQTIPFMSVGANGVISVASNVIPDVVSNMVNLALDGKFVEAREIHLKYHRFFEIVLGIETNPIPVKSALAMMGKVSGEFRLPLVPISDANRGTLEEILREFGLIS